MPMIFPITYNFQIESAGGQCLCHLLLSDIKVRFGSLLPDFGVNLSLFLSSSAQWLPLTHNLDIMKFIFSIVCLALGGFTNAQDCTPWMVMTKGSLIETSNYNAKGKLSDKTSIEILENTKTAEGYKARVKSSGADAKGKETTNMEFDVRCEKGTFFMDMKQFIDQKSMEAYQSMEMKFSGTDLEFPSVLVPGSNLPDGTFTMEAFMNGIKMITMNIAFTNRKVVSKESVTVPAGTFECYKITYDSELKAGFAKKSYKYVTWYAPEVGAVKSEFYNAKGSLDGYSEMTVFKKG